MSYDRHINNRWGSASEPTHEFSHKLFDQLKLHLGEPNMPKTAREAWQRAHVPLKKRVQVAA